MKKNISILAMNHFFDDVIEELKDNYKIIYLQDLSEHYSSISGIITTPWSRVDCELITKLPNLKIISCFGVGIDSVDKKAAKEQSVIITNTPDIVTEDTADIAMTLLLCLSRNIVYNDQYVRSNRWKNLPPPLGTSVFGKTLGIVGLGNIGQRLAERALNFGLKIIYYSRTQKNVSYQFYDDLIEMAEKTHFLAVCCTGGEETRDIINLEVLKALGNKGYLINVSRGTTVNEEALIFALKNNVIAGAGLDVYSNEPYVPEELFAMDNVVLLPHIGTATKETREKMLTLVINNIKSFFEAGIPLTQKQF